MSAIQLAISSAALHPLGAEEALPRLAEIGFTFIELIAMGGKFPDLLGDWDAARIRALLDKHNLQLAAIYSYPINVHSEEKLAHSLKYIRRSMDIAHELGCRNLVLCPLVPRENYPYEKLAAALSELANDIGERDLRLCIENHHGWPMDNTDDYTRVFDACEDKRVGVTLDTGHFGASRVDMPAFIQRFAPRIFHVHLKEQIGTECVAFGTGETPNREAFAALRAIGYQGFASIEVEMKDADNLPQILDDAKRYSQTVLNLTT